MVQFAYATQCPFPPRPSAVCFFLRLSLFSCRSRRITMKFNFTVQYRINSLLLLFGRGHLSHFTGCHRSVQQRHHPKWDNPFPFSYPSPRDIPIELNRFGDCEQKERKTKKSVPVVLSNWFEARRRIGEMLQNRGWNRQDLYSIIMQKSQQQSQSFANQILNGNRNVFLQDEPLLMVKYNYKTYALEGRPCSNSSV